MNSSPYIIIPFTRAGASPARTLSVQASEASLIASRSRVRARLAQLSRALGVRPLSRTLHLTTVGRDNTRAIRCVSAGYYGITLRPGCQVLDQEYQYRCCPRLPPRRPV